MQSTVFSVVASPGRGMLVSERMLCLRTRRHEESMGSAKIAISVITAKMSRG